MDELSVFEYAYTAKVDGPEARIKTVNTWKLGNFTSNISFSQTKQTVQNKQNSRRQT